MFATLAALPLVLPPLVGTVAFIFLLGESGILARFVQSILGLENSPWSLRGWAGAAALSHLHDVPVFLHADRRRLRRIDAALAEAAQSLGAGRLRVLTRVVLPQLTPSLIAAGLLTFMTSMASFSAPLLFGGGVRVLTLEIYTARQRGDAGVAVTETVILAVISLSALIVFQRYEGTRKFAAAAMKGATKKRQPITGGGRTGDCRGLRRDIFADSGPAGGHARAGQFCPRRAMDRANVAPVVHARKLREDFFRLARRRSFS